MARRIVAPETRSPEIESTAGSAAQIIEASSGMVMLPSGQFASDAQYLQQGDDLLLIGPDGATVVVRGYFLLDNPPVLARMQALLGTAVQLHSATSRVTEPGTEDQNWHRDVPWPVDPEGTPYGALPGQINCGYYLDELTMENGPVVIVPGSHRVPFRPPECHSRFPEEFYVLAKPGQAVMFDGWIYHRGVANNAMRRRVCLMCYQNAWMKSRESFEGPKARHLREHGTDEQKLLLGAVEKW